MLSIKNKLSKLFEISGKSRLMVAEASSNKLGVTEQEIQHYYMIYSEDGTFLEIQRNYKID